MNDLLRFDDVRLGEAVRFPQTDDAMLPLDERACAFVRQWSGSDRVQIVSVFQQPSEVLPDSVAGRVVARHLDGSNQTDIEIRTYVRDTMCACAVVRVALA